MRDVFTMTSWVMNYDHDPDLLPGDAICIVKGINFAIFGTCSGSVVTTSTDTPTDSILLSLGIAVRASAENFYLRPVLCTDGRVVYI